MIRRTRPGTEHVSIEKTMTQTKLTRIDCTRDYPADQFFSTGDTTVVDGPAGRYREAAGKPLSRFGYRFQIRNIGRPHLAVIRYPDDRQRFMCVMDSTTYDLSTGITTGFAYPVSGEMREIRNVFWPRWQDCTLVFMTWGHGEPAAVANIEIYELDELPALAPPVTRNGGGPRRELGIQYEDPCGTGCSEGALSKAEWVERVIAYARHTGQTLFAYPLAWYHGPQWPSECEPADAFDCVVARDRKQYVRWTTTPPEWVVPMLKRFEAEGLEFVGALTLLRLGSLMKKMNTDLAAIQAGADTINSMLWNDQVQSGTMDWTVKYNALNYPAMIKAGTKFLGGKNDPALAYGEKTPGDLDVPYHPGPVFNPLHPEVRQAVRAVVRELGSKYGGFKAFKGVSINFWAPTIVWFGSLHSGYDDYTVGLFEKETGIKVPVEPKDPKRFSKRYEFLCFHCRPAWIEWRCQKVHEQICGLRDELVAARPDLRLTLTLWSEPYLPQFLGNGKPLCQLHARPSTVELYREAGFDPALYRGERNLECDFQFEGGGRDRGANNLDNAPLEYFFMFRDHDFLDRETLESWRDLAKPGAFIFNAWHEAWGKHIWFPCDADDPQKDALAVMSGQPAEGIFRMNSEYPKDGFWFDSQLRITHAFPPGEHFLEQYAHAVAELDACRITRGGLFLDKAHSAELRGFAAAYRALPAEKFETVGDATDPVAVRTLVGERQQKGIHHKERKEHKEGGAGDGRRYLYLVNREYYPVTVTVTLSQAGELTDLADGATVAAPAAWTLELQPYELRSFTTAPEVEPRGFTVTIPAKIEAALQRETEQALRDIAAARQADHQIAGLDRIEADLRQCLAAKHLSRLRHLLTGYHVRKCQAWTE